LGATPERGVFDSVNGGKTWQKILFRDDKPATIDLILIRLMQIRFTPRFGKFVGRPGGLKVAVQEVQFIIN
jgi:hypothetical protein